MMESPIVGDIQALTTNPRTLHTYVKIISNLTTVKDAARRDVSSAHIATSRNLTRDGQRGFQTEIIFGDLNAYCLSTLADDFNYLSAPASCRPPNQIPTQDVLKVSCDFCQWNQKLNNFLMSVSHRGA